MIDLKTKSTPALTTSFTELKGRISISSSEDISSVLYTALDWRVIVFKQWFFSKALEKLSK